MNYSDCFSIDDVIEITNDSLPNWCYGKWRVAEVSERSAIVRPLHDDLTIDAERDDTYEYIIANGGIESRRRGDPNLRIGPKYRSQQRDERHV